MPYLWNPAAARYYDPDGGGRFVPRATVLDYVSDSLAGTTGVTDELASLVASGGLSPADWHELMRQEIKREYIRQYLVGRGGLDQMTAQDWGSIGGMLAEQYGYLDGFAGQVGNLTEGQIKVRQNGHQVDRAGMYISSAREAYERGSARANRVAGMGEERWIVDSGKENCGGCLSFAGEGWQDIGYFPFPGQGETPCLTKCGCHKDYR